MKVKNLIEKLLKLNEEADVVIATENDIASVFEIKIDNDYNEILLDSDMIKGN